MKILHVITSLLHGGAEKLMVDLLPRFKAMGCEVELAVFNAVDTDFMSRIADAGVPVHRFAGNGCNVYHPANLLKLRHLLKKGRYDIVHTHNTAPQLFAALCAGTSDTRLVTTEHNTTNRRRSVLFKPVDRWMYGRYDAVVCISDDTLRALRSHIGASHPEKYRVINNGIDLEAFAGADHTVDPDGTVTVTMVAGFRPQKDQDTLVKAIAQLPPRYRLRLVGDGERRPQIEALVDSLGIADRTELTGVRSDIPRLLGESDVVVLSTHYEGQSLASIEAMASGRAFIAADVPGLSDIAGGSALMFPQGDAAALAGTIQRAATDPALYRLTVSRCRECAAAYDIDNTAKAYHKLYQDLTDV